MALQLGIACRRKIPLHKLFCAHCWTMPSGSSSAPGRKFGRFSRIFHVFRAIPSWICILLRLKSSERIPTKITGKRKQLGFWISKRKRSWVYSLPPQYLRVRADSCLGAKKKVWYFGCCCCENICSLRSYLSHKGHLAQPVKLSFLPQFLTGCKNMFQCKQ